MINIGQNTTFSNQASSNSGPFREKIRASIIQPNFQLGKPHGENIKSKTADCKTRAILETLDKSVETYMQGFSKYYSKIVFMYLASKHLELVNKIYIKRQEILDSYEDQIKELKMIQDNADNPEAATTISLMIDQLYVDKNKEEMDANTDFDSRLTFLLSHSHNKIEELIGNSDQIKTLINTFIDKVSKICEESIKK